MKVATPDAAFTARVPPSVPPGLTEAVTVAELPVTVFPPVSRTEITGCVVSGAPEAAPSGWVVTTSWAAAPAPVTEILFETTGVSEPEVTRSL